MNLITLDWIYGKIYFRNRLAPQLQRLISRPPKLLFCVINRRSFDGSHRLIFLDNMQFYAQKLRLQFNRHAKMGKCTRTLFRTGPHACTFAYKNQRSKYSNSCLTMLKM